MNTHGITQIIIKLMEREARKPRQGKEGLVHHPPILLWTGIVCGGLFAIPGLILPLATGNWETWPFLIFVGLSLCCIIAYINCRIWYDEESFTVGYFFGFRRIFTYSEIESIRKQRDVKLKVRGCSVLVDELAVGKKEFLDVARKQYRIAHGGKAIPEAPVPKWDVFNGHVDNAGEFLVGFLVVFLFIPATMLFCFLLSEPTPMEEMTIVTGPVEALWISEDDDTDLVLVAEGTEMEVWGYAHTLTDADAFLAACESGETFTLGYRIVLNDEKEITAFSVEYIEDTRGNVWITPRAAYNNRFREVFIIFGIFEVAWMLMMAATIYVGRNPHKFSKRVIRLFFKDGYVH